jgi:hypothetical protein
MSTIENERLSQIEQHLRLIKEREIDRDKVLSNIQNALIGSDFNGHKGVVSSLKDIDNRVEDLEDFKGEVNIYVRQAKFVIGAMVVILLGIFAKLFNLK